MTNLQDFWVNKRVFITGHTGFKGSWLVLTLIHLGAKVCGYSTNSIERKSIFKSNSEKFSAKIIHIVGDIRDFGNLSEAITDFNPDIIFHLAAQPLVLTSIKNPIQTWETNLMGTNILMESIKRIKNKCAVIIITTDKVYENNNLKHSFSETDRLGGHDPYSASKACVEHACKSWYQTYIHDESNSSFTHISLATARAGNVIGGGDWSDNRLIPDCIRATEENIALNIRNPSSTRPWQHVLDCLYGYLLLAEYKYADQPNTYDSFNFGPPASSNKNVLQVIEEVKKSLPCIRFQIRASGSHQESKILQLNSEKAQHILKWHNRYDFDEAVRQTINWYNMLKVKDESYDISIEQVENFFSNL